MNRAFLLLTFFGLFFSVNAQVDYQNELIVPIEEYNQVLSSSYGVIVYQVTDNDSIVLKNKFEYFFTIEIFTNGIKVLEFGQHAHEIDVFGQDICYKTNDLFIFKVNRRPNICNGFLIFKRNDQNIRKLGFIESNSAYIFGHIYGDNRFVIGGFTNHIQMTSRDEPFSKRIDSYKKNINELLRIYSVSDKVERDYELEKKFRSLLIEMLYYPLSGIYKGFGYAVTKSLDLENLSTNSLRKYAALSVYKLNPNMLKEFSAKELRLMRNEIFANHGYIFRSDDLRKYFSQQKWYNPSFENVDHLLTEIEKHNVNMILNEESKRSFENE